MIVGIDDSGDFQTGEYGLFACVFIRPKKARHIQKVYEKWEASLPESTKHKGEVKGWLLNYKQLEYFVENIMIDNGYGQIRHQVYAISNSDKSIEINTKNRDRYVKQCLDASEDYRSKGNKKMAVFYQEHSAWLSSKSDKTMSKLGLLGFTVYKAFNLAIITSLNRGFDKELGKLTIKIDQGMVGRPSVKAYWLDMMRVGFWSLSRQDGGIIRPIEWGPKHPFVKRFMQYPSATESLVVFSTEVPKSMNFYDSKDHFEIRIADVVASAYYRYYVQGQNELKGVIRRLGDLRVIFDAMITVRQVTDNYNYDTSNPYTDRIHGVTLNELKQKYGSKN